MQFTAYGMTFDSDIELPEFSRAVSAGPVDVRITTGTVPEHLDDSLSSGVLYEVSASRFLLRVPDVASYLVSDDQIVVEICDGSTEQEARVFMLGSAMGALLHMRRLLVLHAAAFTFDERAVLLAGPSGSGKSTLLGALVERGYPMIVDDVCAVDIADDDPWVRSGYARTRLWADSAGKLDVDVAALPRTRPTLEKYERQVPNAFDPEPRSMRTLYLLNARNEETFEIAQLTAIDAFRAVLANTYRRAFIDGLEMRAEHFRLATSIASIVPVKVVSRPRGGFELDRLADLIEQDLRSGDGEA